MHRFEGQVAVVTGAATGIGFEIASRLGKEGAKVLIVDHEVNRAEQSAKDLKNAGIDVLLQVGDVGDPELAKTTVKQVMNTWGRIDILINNAGILGPEGNIWDLPVEEMDSVYRTNLRGTYLYCHYFIPTMMKRNYGRIVNVASIAGKDGNARQSIYSSTKAGVIALTKSIGKELATTGIRVNCVTPALIKTKFIDRFTPEHIEYLKSIIPIGRIGEVEEVASMVTWLASDECSFTTGAVFDISGGRATY